MLEDAVHSFGYEAVALGGDVVFVEVDGAGGVIESIGGAEDGGVAVGLKEGVGDLVGLVEAGELFARVLLRGFFGWR